jgi:hypothetical protein
MMSDMATIKTLDYNEEEEIFTTQKKILFEPLSGGAVLKV